MKNVVIFNLANTLSKINIFALHDRELKSALLKDFFVSTDIKKKVEERINGITTKFRDDFQGKEQTPEYTEALQYANNEIEQILIEEWDGEVDFAKISLEQLADIEQDNLNQEDMTALATVIKMD